MILFFFFREYGGAAFKQGKLLSEAAIETLKEVMTETAKSKLNKDFNEIDDVFMNT